MRKKNFATGDLNFASALVTIGFPLFKDKPITLVASANGGDYKRFHFDFVSMCGKHEIYSISDAWRLGEGFSVSNPNHPLTKIMRFLDFKSRSCRAESDWLEESSKFLNLPIDSILKSYKTIKQVCAANPESEVSYILAYIRNRENLIQDIKEMDANGEFSTLQTYGNSIVNIGAKVSRDKKNFILSHIK